MTNFLHACIQANQEIVRALNKGFDPSWFEKTVIGAGGDVSSRLDLFAEEIFVKYLASFGKIESEESGIIGEGDEKIIIDPVDGSANALSFFPYYGSSIAKINADGVLDAAVVCNFATNDLFFKVNSMPVKQGKLFDTLYGSPRRTPDAEIGLFEKAYVHPKLVAMLDKNRMKFRSPGAIALSLAYAHSVNYVLFIGEYRIYDVAAGLALCEGLEVIVEQDYVIVSKDKKTVKIIENLIKESNA